jgi:hypothetical protein
MKLFGKQILKSYQKCFNFKNIEKIYYNSFFAPPPPFSIAMEYQYLCSNLLP